MNYFRLTPGITQSRCAGSRRAGLRAAEASREAARPCGTSSQSAPAVGGQFYGVSTFILPKYLYLFPHSQALFLVSFYL